MQIVLTPVSQIRINIRWLIMSSEEGKVKGTPQIGMQETKPPWEK